MYPNQLVDMLQHSSTIKLKIRPDQEVHSLAATMRDRNRRGFLSAIIKDRKSKRAHKVSLNDSQNSSKPSRRKQAITYYRKRMIDVICLMPTDSAGYELTDLDKLLIIELRLASANKRYDELERSRKEIDDQPTV